MIRMKNKKILLLGLLFIPVLFSGCIEYGQGKTYGYITTQEDGLFEDSVWFRADLASSNTDCYTVRRGNYELKQKLNHFAETKERVVMTFGKNIIEIFGCSSDVVINVEAI